jgi:CRISPR/Cas system-associated protein Csm6
MISRANLVAGALVGALAVFLIMTAINALWLLPRATEAGRDEERAAALTRSMEIIKERSRTNAQINALTDADLCRELGGLFKNGECR